MNISNLLAEGTLHSFAKQNISQNIFILIQHCFPFTPCPPLQSPNGPLVSGWADPHPPTGTSKHDEMARYDLPTLVSYVSGHFSVFVVQITLCAFSLKSLGQVLKKRISLTPPPMYVGYWSTLSISNIMLSVLMGHEKIACRTELLADGALKIRPRMCTQPDRAPTFRQRAASQAGREHETGEWHCLLPSTLEPLHIEFARSHFLLQYQHTLQCSRKTWWKSV